jgi:hypothetical protein
LVGVTSRYSGLGLLATLGEQKGGAAFAASGEKEGELMKLI